MKDNKLMIKFKQLLKQNPDGFYILLDEKPNTFNGFMDGNDRNIVSLSHIYSLYMDIQAFCYIDGILICTKDTSILCKSHYQLYNSFIKKYPKDMPLTFLQFAQKYLQILTYPGRIFQQAKIISFWHYPTKKQMIQIIKDLNSIYGYNIDNTWKLNICLDESKLDQVDRLYSKHTNKWYKARSDKYQQKLLQLGTNKNRLLYNQLIIPISDYYYVYDYIDSVESAKQDIIQHVLSPLQKKFDIVWQKIRQLPKNMSQAEYNNKKTRYTFTQHRRIRNSTND